MKKMKAQLLLSAILLTGYVGFSQASTRTITGIVTSYDESSPLEGVLVAVKGSNNQSGSQPDGIYYISVHPDDSVLIFSYSDFETQEIKISGSNEYNITLKRAANQKKRIAPFPIGGWRGVFQLRKDLQVPFNFEISGTAPNDAKVFLMNAEEKFFAGNVKQSGDSLFIPLDQFDNELAFKIEGDKLYGVLRKQDKTGNPIPVFAEWGKANRFDETGEKPVGNISGKFDVIFKGENGSDTKTVGLISQNGSKVRAVFLRTTGDSRFLEGIIEGNKLYLSSFIGSSPSYYQATINSDGTITGETMGARGGQPFTGIRNEKASLPDPYTLTNLKPGYTSFDFSFPNLEGKTISPKDEKYRNKVLIVTITGTWCPNCLDEAAFLAPWYKKNKQRGVEAIAIHYERQLDSTYLKKVLTRFKDRFGIEYDEVIGGVADKKQVAASLPSLNTFLAFPTILFIDKKGIVSKIYTGYTGPATGKYYEQFVKEFNDEVDHLLKK